MSRQGDFTAGWEASESQLIACGVQEEFLENGGVLDGEQFVKAMMRQGKERPDLVVQDNAEREVKSRGHLPTIVEFLPPASPSPRLPLPVMAAGPAPARTAHSWQQPSSPLILVLLCICVLISITVTSS